MKTNVVHLAVTVALLCSGVVAPAVAQTSGPTAPTVPTATVDSTKTPPAERMADGLEIQAPVTAAGVSASADGDETIPGVWRNWWHLNPPFNDYADPATDAWDVYPVHLEAGETYDFRLTGAPAAFGFFLFAPTAVSVTDVAHQTGVPYGGQQRLAGTAPVEGQWYVAVHAVGGGSAYSLGATFFHPNDDVPGAPLVSAPGAGHLDSFSDWSDVHYVWLSEGDVISVSLSTSGAVGDFQPSLYLYPPGTGTVLGSPDWVVTSSAGAYPRSITYKATRSGVYYLDVYQQPYPADRASGSTQVAWSVASPVHRFYNATSGTHFFTPSADEVRAVIALHSSVYAYEGVAYHTRPYANPQPLYRFYNKVNASHFYTASAEEANTVMARWPHIFSYDGETYKVSLSGPAEAAVYRFYNRRNGSHFYTASAVERDQVYAGLGHIYTYEGVAFYLNP